MNYNYDPVEIDKLTKGLHAFHLAPGQKGTKLPDDYLADYLDAFIEEAYEHEYAEERHRVPRLEGGDPHMHLARAVYNELLVFAVHNQNLRRAISKFGIKHPKFILDCLNRLGLCRVNSENYTAAHDAQVGGYHPEKVEPLGMESKMMRSMDAAFAATERSMIEHNIRGGHVLSKGPEMVQLVDDTVDPMAELKKAHDARPDAFGRMYVMDQGAVRATVDQDCVIHGSRDLTKSMNLANTFAHCTCPPADD